MSDSLLHKVMGQKVAAQAASRPAPGAGLPGQAGNGGAAAASEPRRGGRHGGRYERWHVDTTPQQEEEAWLIAYLDVVTLLLAMMVVMLAFSEPISESFRGENRESALDSASTVVQTASDSGTSVVPPVPLPQPATAPAPAEGPPVSTQAASPPPGLPIGDLGNNIQVDVGRGVVRFRISSEVLFGSGEATLTPAGQQVMDRLLPAFNQAQDHSILVEGHTDNVPIATVRFPSNWELAASRAGSVVRHLESRGLNPTRLRATGLSDTRPIASNATLEGRATNRRVEITLEAPPNAR